MESSLSSLSKSFKIPNFSPQLCLPIWSNTKEYLKNTLILCGFDPYSPLCYLIHDYFIKLVSLIFFMRIYLYSMIVWTCFVKRHRCRGIKVYFLEFLVNFDSVNLRFFILFLNFNSHLYYIEWSEIEIHLQDPNSMRSSYFGLFSKDYMQLFFQNCVTKA